MDNKLLSKTFLWMSLGLIITFITSYIVISNEIMYANIYSKSWYIIFMIIEFCLVIFLSARIMKMSINTARCLYILYSIISGLTFTSIFITYELSSIIFIFLVTAVFFAVLAVIGLSTKTDMTGTGKYFIIGLLFVIVVAIINAFLKNGMLSILISVLIVILFVGITIYDIQKIKRLEHSNLPVDNLAIYGALQLYLDFINIFIQLLRLYGDRRN